MDNLLIIMDLPSGMKEHLFAEEMDRFMHKVKVCKQTINDNNKISPIETSWILTM